ncbi:DUF2812 domain-containing protein [Saccharibacillus kuerlensis]|uniref:DUF2812 domain-containing protein n=1 Tax=Saccharibacillus kuerlensis TaxID=459527 RepID=A0ABQ2KZI0_9BACL|nr:DUF2812 domain-containing protein [Saccharibacillus kuerlensis]GGN97664.1 hypothetical protein GCM10010969_15730 [Saccharibacillus kuerlensis]
MRDKKKTKWVMKKFTDFKAEEMWLESMFHKGWALSRYNSEEIDECTYVFEAIKPDEVRSRTYRIDYRPLKGKAAFEEYNSLFEDAGWQRLAKNSRYAKHIFWTDREDAASDIFSEDDSYKEREQRKMKSCLMNALAYCIVLTFAVSIYIWLKYPAIIAGMGAVVLGILSSLRNYVKHHRVYRTFP